MQCWISASETWWNFMGGIGMPAKFVVRGDKVIDFIEVVMGFYHVKSSKWYIDVAMKSWRRGDT